MINYFIKIFRVDKTSLVCPRSALVILFVLMAFVYSHSSRANETITQPVIGAHLVAWNVSLESALWYIDLLDKYGYNTLILQLRSGVILNNSPWTPLENALDEDELRQISVAARESGIEIIPELKLLTHQEKFFQSNYDNLLFNSVTYDPRKEQTYEVVFKFLDEVISIFNPSAVHIGHDESPGWKGKFTDSVIKEGEPILPAELFLKDVEILTEYLDSKGIATWMWGDMLIAPDELPSMLVRHIHGSYEGYGKSLRSKLSREIVIVDWHYNDAQKDFPSIEIFGDEGFKVLGASFSDLEAMRNFTTYAEGHGAAGMIATTWYLMPHQKYFDVENILEESGVFFRRHFIE